MVEENRQEPGEIKPETPETKAESVEDLEALKNALKEATAKVEVNLAGWQRAQADFINYKRRCEQERDEARKLANSALVLSLLPVLDDFERAFASIPTELAEHEWVNGIKLIERKLRSALEAHGLAEIKALGEPFDTDLHEAVMHVSGKENTVVQEMQKGYKLYDKVIRPSKVAVGNGQEEKEA